MKLTKSELVKINKLDNFYVRLRKEQSQSDIIYYDGFKINNESKEKISNSFFEFNCTNISKSLKKKERETLIKEMQNFRNECFDTYRLRNVKLNKSEYAKKNNEIYKKKLNEIKTMFKDINIENENNIIIKFDDIEQEFNLLKFLWNIDDNGNRDDKTAVFKDIDVKYEKTGGDLGSEEHIKNIVPKLTKFYEKYTKLEEEKKYQHLFLLNIKNDKENEYLHKVVFGEKEIKAFEEEYYIKYPGGRIDCIFYATKGDFITDIYLIELKVDDNVLAGSNGIPTHLIDIENIDKNVFNNELIDRINYRNCYNNDDIEKRYKYANEVKTHFFVIIGRINCEKEQIKKFIDDLNDPESKLYKSVKIKDRKNEPIKNIAKRIIEKDIDVKLFIDKNKWDTENKNGFKPIYEEYEKAYK